MLFSVILIPALWCPILARGEEVEPNYVPQSNSTVLAEDIFGAENVIRADEKSNSSSVIDDLSRRNVTDDEKREAVALEGRFRRKYMGKGYTKWQELHDVQPANLTKVCYKDAMVMFNNPNLTMRVTAEGKASFRDSYNVTGFNKIEIDTLTCSVKFLDAAGNAKVKLEYYFCEGDEPNSAFRFTLAQKTFVLSNRIRNIWSDPIPKADQFRPAIVQTKRV